MAPLSTRNRILLGTLIALLPILVASYALYLEELRHNEVMEQHDQQMKELRLQFNQRIIFEAGIHKENLASKR